MLTPDQVTACVVTDGANDLAPILESLVFDKIIVHDNSRQEDLGVYGRYAAAANTDTDVVWFQDDDALVPQEAQHRMLALYRDGVYLSNMDDWRNRTEYPLLTLAGFGSLARRDLPAAAFARWQEAGGDTMSDGWRLAGCDIVFSLLTLHERVDVGHTDLPYSAGPGRVHRHPAYQGWKRSFYDSASWLREPVKLNLGCGAYPLDGFVNLDAETGWRFEDGLPDYPDKSVDAITVSHALMYLPISRWPTLFAEFARVLAPGGVIRISEDDARNTASPRFGGYPGAATLTDASLVETYLEAAGLAAGEMPPGESLWPGGSLVQRRHGDPPKVFFVEAVAA